MTEKKEETPQKEEGRPQSQSQLREAEAVIAKSIGDEFDKMQKLTQDRKGALTNFRRAVIEKLMAVEKILAEVTQMFKGFSLAEDSRIENCPVLVKGHKFYFDHMRMQSGKVVEALDQELENLTQWISTIENDRKTKIDDNLKYYRSTMQQISTMSSCSPQENLKEAIKTIRKLPIFGKHFQNKIDFEWPLEKDLLAMPKDKQITLRAMSFTKSDIYTALGGLQLHFSNGVDSPKFLAEDQSAEGLERIDIPQDKKAKTIRCRIKGGTQYHIREVTLLDKDEQEILKYSAHNYGNYFSEQLKEGEEIIGCYGIKDQDECYSSFGSLGFLVWKPPKTV